MIYPIGTITLAGGGTLGIAPCPRVGDQAAFAVWAPDAVLTLIPPGPRADLVGAMCATLGITWHHLPIVDFAAPEAAFEAAWPATGAVLRARLRDGGRVLVHCMAGLGRSGMIAARLLVELGEKDPEAAIEAVRAVRHGAIETEAQEDHVRAQRPLR